VRVVSKLVLNSCARAVAICNGKLLLSSSFQTEWRIRFANGDDYAGTVMDGAPHGTGTYKYSNGDIFTGG